MPFRYMIAALCLLSASAAVARDWRYIGSGADDAVLFMDADSTRPLGGGRYEALLRYDYSVARAKGPEHARFISIDCRTRTYVVKAVSEGMLIQPETVPAALRVPRKVVAGSMMDAVLGRTCPIPQATYASASERR